MHHTVYRLPLIFLCLVGSILAQAQTPSGYQFSSRVDNVNPRPGGSTPFYSGSPSSDRTPINNRGEIIANGSRISETGITPLANGGTPMPGGGFLYQFPLVGLNNNGVAAGTVVVNYFPGQSVGVYTFSGSSIGTIASGGSAAPGGGNYNNNSANTVFIPNINDNGDVAFFHETTTNSNGNLYLGNGTTTQRITGSGLAAPGGGTFLNFDEVNLNNRGDVVFHATTTGGPGWGIYQYGADGQNNLRVARGDSAPGGGTFQTPRWPDINEAGNLSFTSATVGGPSQAAYLMQGASISLLAAVGQTMPGGEVVQGIHPYTSLNNNNLAVFATRAGAANNSALTSIYVSDGTTPLKVVGVGDFLFGSTVTNINYYRQALNDQNQVVFNYVLSNGQYGIAVANPFAAVPEPTSLLLLGLVALPALTLRRRGQ